MGALLVLLPEFIYLRDNFSTRMNTVFKFSYQAWAAFSIAGAYAVYTILADFKLARPPMPQRPFLVFGWAKSVGSTKGTLVREDSLRRSGDPRHGHTSGLGIGFLGLFGR